MPQASGATLSVIGVTDDLQKHLSRWATPSSGSSLSSRAFDKQSQSELRPLPETQANSCRPAPALTSYFADQIQTAYLYTAPLLLLFTSLIHPYFTLIGVFKQGAEFLPLMMTSVWCSAGLWIAWLRICVGVAGKGSANR